MDVGTEIRIAHRRTFLHLCKVEPSCNLLTFFFFLNFVHCFRPLKCFFISQDQDQPLILHRPKKKSVSEEEANKIICLIPELCMLTGMTDAMRADFKIMKEVAVFTRVTPEARRQSMASFVKRINSSEEAKTVLANWGLTIEPEPVLMSAR